MDLVGLTEERMKNEGLERKKCLLVRSTENLETRRQVTLFDINRISVGCERFSGNSRSEAKYVETEGVASKFR
jgi:hypothetical protein